MAPASSPSSAPLSFEAALAELEKIVRELETGKTGLEDSITAYERGVALRNQCQRQLSDMQLRIEKLTLAPDGSVVGAPFNPVEE